MLICEQFLILLLDDDKGKRHSSTAISRDVGLAGAFLIDLFLKGHISIEEERIKVIKTMTTGDSFLDQILAEINMSPKVRTVKSWLGRIGKRHKYFTEQFYYRFEQQGLIKSEVKTILKIFHSKRYHFVDDDVKYQILVKIQKAVLEEEKPDIETFSIMNLLRHTELYRGYIAKEYRKIAKNRLEMLDTSQIYEPKIQEMILLVSKGIKEIIAGRRAAATSAATAAS